MITRVDVGQIDVATNSVAFTAPLTALVQPGDVIVFTITTTSSTASTATPTDSTGSIFASGVGTSDAVQSQGWYLVVPDPVPANVRVQFGATRQGTLGWVAYRGVDNANPLDVAPIPGNQSAASSSTPSLPSITTVTPGAMILGGLSHGSGSTTATSIPSPWALIVDGTRRNGMIFEKGVQAGAGASGAAAITLSGTQQNRAWTVALRPAAETPTDAVEATLTSEPYPGFSEDVADGAAIIPDLVTPANSVVITTNKDTGGGLYVLDMAGEILSTRLDGAANSVDWRDLTGVTGWDNRVLVMTSDREDGLLRFYWLNRTTKVLTPAGASSALGWEPYGTCLYVHSDGQVYAFVTQRGTDDTSPRNFYQYPLTRSSETVTMGAAARTVSTASVVEGLAADDLTGYLYASEEDVGLYRYSAAPTGGSTRTTIDTVGAGNLFADVEDVSIARTSEGAWLLVSSQGDSSFHVYDLDTLAHVQRFTIMRPGGSDQVTSTDGLDVLLTNLGPTFPNGLIVVHDGDQPTISDFAFVDAALVFGELPAVIPSGSSVAGVAVAAQGAGHRLASGSDVAGVGVSAQGSGTKASRGASTASVGVAAFGSGRKVVSRAGTSGVSVQASGTGSKHSLGGSVATLSVAAFGDGRRVESGRGGSVAGVRVSAQGHGLKYSAGGTIEDIGVVAFGAGRRVADTPMGGSMAQVALTSQGSGRKAAHDGAVTFVAVSAFGKGRNPAAIQVPVLTLTLTGTGIVTTLTGKTSELTLEKV